MEWDVPDTDANAAAFGFAGVAAELADRPAYPKAVLINPKIRGKARQKLLAAARAGQNLQAGQARYVRVVEYTVPDRSGHGKDELIALVTTITEQTAAPASALAEAYHQRWEHESGNQQLKTYLRGPGKVLRSQSPDMVRQEIYGYPLTVALPQEPPQPRPKLAHISHQPRFRECLPAAGMDGQPLAVFVFEMVRSSWREDDIRAAVLVRSYVILDG